MLRHRNPSLHFRRIGILSVFVCLILFQYLVGNPQSVSPQPESDPSEKWRWRTYEALNDRFIFCGTELPNGELLFVSDTALLYFDGYRVREEPFPAAYSTLRTVAIYLDDDGTLYLNTEFGLFAKQGKSFQKLANYSHFFPQSRPLFAKTEDGLLITGCPDGIYGLSDGTATLISPLESGVSSMVNINGRLYMSPTHQNEIFHCEFTLSGIQNVDQYQYIRFEPRAPIGTYLFPGASENELWAIAYSRGKGIHQINTQSQKIQFFQNKNDSQDKTYLSGKTLANSDILLLGKSSTFLIRNQQWIELTDYPSNGPLDGTFYFSKQNGNLVVGGRITGVMEIDLSSDRFRIFPNYHYLCSDRDHRKWFISRAGDVLSQNTGSGTWIQHSKNPHVIDTPSGIMCSTDGIVWVYGAHKGQAALSRYNGVAWVMDIHPTLGERLSHNGALQLNDGRLLFGSGRELSSYDENEEGIVIYHKKEGSYHTKTYGEPIAPFRINSIAQLDNGELWTGGFSLFNIDPTFSRPYRKEFSASTWIENVSPAGSSELYVTIRGRGILKGNGNNWKSVAQLNKTSTLQISDIQQNPNRQNSFWISTAHGISRLENDELTEAFVPAELGIDYESGTLAQNESEGHLWINQTQRLWYFSTREEREATNYKFRTIEYRPNQYSPQVEVLDYEEKSNEPTDVYISWKGFDKWSETPTANLLYSYQFNDKSWSPYSHNTHTTLLNTPAGEHQVHIRVRDSDGNIGELIKPITFKVYPPLWKSPWFITAVSLMTGITLLSIYLLIRQRVRHLLELDDLKLQFFTNMSHELRSPLTLIIGPLETLMDNLPNGANKKQAEIAHSNSRKMLHLVDQILEFRKAEFGSLESILVKQNIIKDIKETVEQHTPLAEQKNISLVATHNVDNYRCEYDNNKLERVLVNLLTNAIKYTKKSGTVIVKTIVISANQQGDSSTHLELIIEDNGDGIDASNLDHIFEPFYRVGKGEGKRARGVGLGLPLVKNLLESMDGSIEVESPIHIESGVRKGSRFRVMLPLKPSTPQSQEEIDPIPAEAKQAHQDQAIDSDSKWILIVEDDAEIREYIGSSLSQEFSVVHAENGLEGLKKAQSIIPDLVLTDVMMPEMDGNELCEKLRADERTSHIPIITLTALNSSEHQLKSLQKGADDFLTKPVSNKILKQKIKNIIQSREQSQQAFQQQSTAHPSPKHSDHPSADLQLNPPDQRFLDKVNTLIKRQLENPYFDVENLSTSLRMSRMTLYRKIKAITGQSPSELIRLTRLQEAAKLLLEGDLTVSEIADKTGYQDLSHFSTSFKKHYHCKPSHYARNAPDPNPES